MEKRKKKNEEKKTRAFKKEHKREVFFYDHLNLK